MATAQINGVVQNLRALVRSTADGSSNGDLLDCYLVRRETVAFESLVRRHGPMVLGVCRRIYPTHMPFMIDLRKPGRIRIVNEGEGGTTLHNDLTQSEPEAKFVH